MGSNRLQVRAARRARREKHVRESQGSLRSELINHEPTSSARHSSQAASQWRTQSPPLGRARRWHAGHRQVVQQIAWRCIEGVQEGSECTRPSGDTESRLIGC